mgnify:CR=1 FL=1
MTREITPAFLAGMAEKFEELAEKENKAFASFMNNNQNGSFSNKKNRH